MNTPCLQALVLIFSYVLIRNFSLITFHSGQAEITEKGVGKSREKHGLLPTANYFWENR
jgi:hypothetical protein